MKHTIPLSCCCNLKWNGYRSSQIPNDNALFRHVCFATNLGELTPIGSTIILFAKHLRFVHTTHTPCPHHNTAMLNSAVSIYKWAMIRFNKTRLFRTMNEQYRHHVAAIQNGTVTTPLPSPSPHSSPNPNPNPNPDPTLNRTTPFHPPARPTDHHRERFFPNTQR